jgi:large subunit ribosomal protein L18
MNRLLPRQRTAMKIRRKIQELNVMRLTVYKTSQHIYAQVFTPDGGKVLAAASSLEKDTIHAEKTENGKVGIAVKVGALIAARAKEKGISAVAFDRSGFKYHGRIKALADSAREHGLEF